MKRRYFLFFMSPSCDKRIRRSESFVCWESKIGRVLTYVMKLTKAKLISVASEVPNIGKNTNYVPCFLFFREPRVDSYGRKKTRKYTAKKEKKERKMQKYQKRRHVLPLYESPLSTQACVHIEDVAVPWNESAMSRASVAESRTNLAWEFREIHRNSELTRYQSHPDNLTCSNFSIE